MTRPAKLMSKSVVVKGKEERVNVTSVLLKTLKNGNRLKKLVNMPGRIVETTCQGPMPEVQRFKRPCLRLERKACLIRCELNIEIRWQHTD
jgi:hypothetical protein